MTDGFGTGRYAMIMDGPWKISEMEGSYPDFEYATAPMPEGEGGSHSVLGGENISMFNTANKDAAWKFMKFMTGEFAQEEMAKRAEQLLMDYPSLIMKFTLLIQAGMTARKVFQKMSTDYMRNRPKTGRYAYEAIIIMCHEMDSGIAELEAYRRFGERCGQMKYKTFSTILIQNLQKGSHRMADPLEKEALEAWDERKRKARVLGETAATKLLVPMVMMLAVVMAIIMIPAFLSFYG